MFQFIGSPLSGKTSYVKFKYISCSNLSCLIAMDEIHITLFKYISCSNLSAEVVSAITLLPIQIHLMFQFIIEACDDGLAFYKFKYISCSNLSLKPLSEWVELSAFKYISCSNLSFTICKYCHLLIIQIHLMFQFIKQGLFL